MKPDQHKKKASLAYKKKHGLTGEKKPAAEVGKGGGRRANDSSAGGEANSSRGTGEAQVAKAIDTTQGADGGQVDTKTFKKRYVQSNWDRYGGLEAGEDEDHITQRGGDFELLLNVATNSFSQFRFADELDWNEEDGDSSAVLSIDCAGLASSLKCVPLDILLGIEKDNFTAEQLEVFKTSARNHLASYMEQIDLVQTETECVEVDMWEADDAEEDIAILPQIDQLSSSTINDFASQAVSTDLKSNEIKYETTKEENRLSKTKTSKPLAKSVHVPKQEDNLIKSEEIEKTPTSIQGHALEEDLDALLELDSPVKACDRDEIDNLFDDVPVKESPLPDEPDVETSAVNPLPQTSGTDLTDWLDDLLDD